MTGELRKEAVVQFLRSTLGLSAAVCMLAFAMIPLSMPFSVYLTYKRFVGARYGQMFLFCCLPLFCCISAPLLSFTLMYLYDPLLIPWRKLVSFYAFFPQMTIRSGEILEQYDYTYTTPYE